MNKPKDKVGQTKDSTQLVAPYARIRVIAFVICLLIAAVVWAYTAFTG